MRVFFFTSILALGITSCADKDNAKTDTIVGKWQLIEVLADPGDGSGTFQPVSSDKSMVFHADGTVTSNGLICSMSIVINQSSTGTYSLADSTLHGSDCPDPAMSIAFEKSGSVLILNYPCIEPCWAKYTRVAGQ